MKIIFAIAILLGALTGGLAQTNNLTGLLQQGLFEEQANRNLEAAIADYQSLATQFDKDRPLAATAVFRLGECYRAQGRTNEAAAQYQRIIREFSDHQILAMLSRQDLAGMGLAETAAQPAATGEETPGAHPATTEAAFLAAQISGIGKLQADPEEQARAVLAIFPEDTLKDMLLNLPKLRDQVAEVKANPQMSTMELLQTRGLRRSLPETGDSMLHPGTNLLEYAQSELDKQQHAIQERVDFILGTQKARLKALQAVNGPVAPGNLPNEATSVVTSDEDNEIRRIQQLIQNSPDLINSPSDGGTPLAQAAFRGWLKVAAYLLDHGADINTTSPDVRWNYDLAQCKPVSPLMAAVLTGNKAMTKFLIDHGADMNFKNDKGDTALHLAARKGFQAVTDTLLASHADVNARNTPGATPLDAAVQSGQLKIVQMTLAAGADIHARDNRDETALNYGIGLSPEVFQSLLAAGADVNTKDWQNRTALSYAAEQDALDAVKALLAFKADPNAGDEEPLLMAVYKKDRQVAESLLQAGAHPDAAGKLNYQVSGDNNLSTSHTSRLTPLWVAIRQRDLAMEQLLLKYKADPNNMQTDDECLLFHAEYDTNALAALLEAGGNADYYRPDKWSPLSQAVQNNNLAAVQLLLKYKADPNHSLLGNDSLLFTAIQNTNMLEALLDAGAEVDPRTKDEANWTPLANAANQNLATAVEILLKHGANPNVRNSNGATPLHWAAYQCVDTNIFDLLLDHGADPNVRSSNGRTPVDELKVAMADSGSWPSRFNGYEAKVARCEELIVVLHQHGALDNPPDWGCISVGRSGDNMSSTIFRKGTNDWNHFTLLEAVANAYLQNAPYNNTVLPFPDLGHVAVLRPSQGSTNETRITVNLLDSTGVIDCSSDVPLRFGDSVDIPERDHSLGDNASGLTDSQKSALANFITGKVRLVVQDRQVEITIYRLGDQAMLDHVLETVDARNILLASSDLSRVKVIRHDAKTGEHHEWIFDCSPPGTRNPPGTFAVYGGRYGGPGGPGQPLSYQWYANGNGNSAASANSLWLCDGDVIEVPQKQ